jgi:branched-chain amino acid transport system substrate-binding protein
MKRGALLLPLLVAAILTFSTAHDGFARRRATQPGGTTLIPIGALFSMTGDGSSLGVASAAALDLAVRDINQEFEELRLPYRVTSIVEDTKLSAAVAPAKLTELAAQGVSLVIGPQSSSEAAAVLEYANAHHIILISQGSTASSLAIAGDNLFRLAPNDKLEGAAMAALMRADGIDTMLPMWRDDAGNRGLHDSTVRSLEAAGGKALPGLSYDPSTSDFHAAVATIGSALRSAKNSFPTAHVAVYLASFEEAAAIFDLARLDADLAGVRWYGGDGVTQSQALITNPAVARFAATTSFTAPNVGLDDSTSSLWQPISDEIKAKVGFQPDAYSLSVYDAAWVAALSAVEAQLRPDVLRASFVRNVQRYVGLTGSTALDEAGDRKFANFDFWTVVDTNGQQQWIRTAQYVGGRVER